MKLIRLAVIAAAAMLAACTPQQQATAVADANVVCHIATVVEATNPTLVAHNGKVIAGQTVLCTTVAALSAPPLAQPAAQ